jgi:hypothetical protein
LTKKFKMSVNRDCSMRMLMQTNANSDSLRMWRQVICVLVISLGVVRPSIALAPAIPKVGVIVYAQHNFEAVGAALGAAATQVGWYCDRPALTNPLARNNLIVQCKNPTGKGFIVADDFVEPLVRASVNGYSDAESLDEMLIILRDFARRASEIPDARVLLPLFPEGR